MLIKTKINLRLYLSLSALSTFGACLFAQNFIEVLVILIIAGATIINQTVLVELVSEMFHSAAQGGLGGGPKVDKGRILVLSIVKIGVMLGAISFGVLFMGNRIIIPVINYVIMIFILAASMDRKGKAL
jgi:hypothetical protein